MRFAWKRPLHYHGLTRTKGCNGNVSDAMTRARSIWFMNGEADYEREAVKGALLNLTHLQVIVLYLHTAQFTIRDLQHSRSGAAPYMSSVSPAAAAQLSSCSKHSMRGYMCTAWRPLPA